MSKAVPFVYLVSVCRSLQCLIPALTQVVRGGPLFRFTCSVVLWGGKGTADKYHWSVWGALAVFQPHWVCPHSQHVCFPCLHCSGSRFLSRERALSCVHFPGLSRSGSGFPVLHKDTDSVGSEFCAFPTRAAQAARSLMSALSLGAVCLIPSAVPVSVSTCLSPVHLVSLLGSCL